MDRYTVFLDTGKLLSKQADIIEEQAKTKQIALEYIAKHFPAVIIMPSSPKSFVVSMHTTPEIAEQIAKLSFVSRILKWQPLNIETSEAPEARNPVVNSKSEQPVNKSEQTSENPS